MNYIEYNNNHKNKKTSDCVIRAIALATNNSWEKVYRELAELGIKQGLIINDNRNWHTKRFNTTMINTYKDFILNNFEFRLVNLIFDKNYNKEVVFYIHQIKKYIVL